MRFLTAFLLPACLAAQALAQGKSNKNKDPVEEFTFTVEATFKGKKIAQKEIKLAKIALGKDANPGKKLGLEKKKEKNEKKKKNQDLESELATRGPAAKNPTTGSANWCGSVKHGTAANQVKLIHAYFQHPTCTKRTGQIYPQASAQWAGIDGDTWGGALLQSGTVCKFDNASATVRNEAWWQWLPNGAYTIGSLPVAPGDWFEVTINTTSNRAGKVTLSNISKGYTYAITISGGAALGRLDAEWVVERPLYGSSLSGFPKFTDVWFQEAYATQVSGTSKLGILGAAQLQIPNLCASAEYDNANAVSWSL
ncbi:concanavalin A-like lectin/glucanase domain-containing protein [Cercophora newfieldiana]|uniref:Concanavalin A-like lectin/glucanase domain-containing protein n=1 Tax=Cercophora newfieldiana TaxID=92897 RepID=A0AA39Y270_9PEZI|nr:concanavalin A-like lectin/glucanase domain-containing protein [Cercophora newfieldiana]